MIKFSVVIPLYNKEKEIMDTLNSVFLQSYQANEVIVVDDGSTDNSAKLIKEQFPNVKLVHQINMGVSVARNRGITEASNEYIALLDGDDLWEINFLKEIKELIELYPDATFYSTATKSIDEYGKIILNKNPKYATDRVLIENFPKVFSKYYGLVNSSSLCIKKTIFDKGIRFLKNEKKGEDICYWLELSLLGGLAFSMNPLSIYKLDASNRSDTIHKEGIVPCPLKWFYKNQNSLKKHKFYKSIRYFIYSNIFITVYGGFALSKNYFSIDSVITVMKQNHDRFYLLLYPAYLMPVGLLEFIKKIRRKLR